MKNQKPISSSHARALRDKKAYRLIVAGSREFDNFALLTRKLDKICRKLTNIVVIHGGAKGTDRLAARWAFLRGWSQRVYHADWKKYGKQAGMIRNKEMAKDGEALIAFWNGSSKGTKDVIDRARKNGLIVKVVKVEKAG